MCERRFGVDCERSKSYVLISDNAMDSLLFATLYHSLKFTSLSTESTKRTHRRTLNKRRQETTSSMMMALTTRRRKLMRAISKVVKWLTNTRSATLVSVHLPVV